MQNGGMATDGYHDRYVAFLDILGFTKLVEKSERDSATFDKVLAITRGLTETARGLAGQYGVLVDNQDIVSTAFSDSIVISVPEPHDKSRTGILYAIVFAVQGLCRKLLLDLGVLTRGGIARGPAYHKDGVLFGRSVIEAYKLEHEVAKVARIAVDSAVAAHWTETFGNPRGLVALRGVIRQDHDGVNFLDLFHFPPNDSIDRGTAEFFWGVSPVLTRLLADKTLDRRALSKVAWLANQYNEAPMLKRLPRSVPVDILKGLL
jgi:hypothetical protein